MLAGGDRESADAGFTDSGIRQPTHLSTGFLILNAIPLSIIFMMVI